VRRRPEAARCPASTFAIGLDLEEGAVGGGRGGAISICMGLQWPFRPNFVETGNASTKQPPPRTRGSVRRDSGFVQICITLATFLSPDLPLSHGPITCDLLVTEKLMAQD